MTGSAAVSRGGEVRDLGALFRKRARRRRSGESDGDEGTEEAHYSVGAGEHCRTRAECSMKPGRARPRRCSDIEEPSIKLNGLCARLVGCVYPPAGLDSEWSRAPTNPEPGLAKSCE